MTVEENDSGRYLQANGIAGRDLLRCSTRRWPARTPPARPGRFASTCPTQGDYARHGLSPTTPSDQQDPSTTGATSRYPIYPGDLPPTVTEDAAARRKAPPSPTARSSSAAGSRTTSRSPRPRWRSNGLGQYMSSSRHVHEHQRELPHGVPEQPGLARVELLVHDPGHPAGSYTVLVRGVDQHGFVTAVPSRAQRDRVGHADEPAAGGQLHVQLRRRTSVTFDGRTSTDENAADADLLVELRQRLGLRPGPDRGPTRARAPSR